MDEDESWAAESKVTRDLHFSATRNLSIAVLLISILAWYWRYTLLLLLVKTYQLSKRSTVREEIFPNMEM